MKICRKCCKNFPVIVEIKGKKRNLNNRKFCLDCSPFGLHNTRKDISKPPIGRNTKERKDQVKLINYKRGWQRKAELIKMSGGKCKKCGYNKCQRALTFHHLDP